MLISRLSDNHFICPINLKVAGGDLDAGICETAFVRPGGIGLILEGLVLREDAIALSQ
jgi:hypothetical protein